jgi:hypothetical protein
MQKYISNGAKPEIGQGNLEEARTPYHDNEQILAPAMNENCGILTNQEGKPGARDPSFLMRRMRSQACLSTMLP